MVMFRAVCGICNKTHESEYEDDLEAGLMACRDRGSPRARGDLDAYADGEVEEMNPPIRPEAAVPR